MGLLFVLFGAVGNNYTSNHFVNFTKDGNMGHWTNIVGGSVVTLIFFALVYYFRFALFGTQAIMGTSPNEVAEAVILFVYTLTPFSRVSELAEPERSQEKSGSSGRGL